MGEDEQEGTWKAHMRGDNLATWLRKTEGEVCSGGWRQVQRIRAQTTNQKQGDLTWLGISGEGEGVC